MHQETNILCFECGKRFGVDCPGRRPNESTRCQICLDKYMEQLKQGQITHIRSIGMSEQKIAELNK